MWQSGTNHKKGALTYDRLEIDTELLCQLDFTFENVTAKMFYFLDHRSKGRSTNNACPHCQDARTLSNMGKYLFDTWPDL